ncbi:MAG: HRDC domain-containing protein, partial [Proteobacteria bacterium]|nr:HRDC domain-containing protein [Pseudomonadota bacterium]
FRNIFDTHRAASLLGCRQLALGKLLETYLGVTLEKKLQRSRWDLRPLREEQLDYAALDTAHLTELAQRLEKGLREKGLQKEAERLFAGMTAVVWQPKILDRLAHRRVPGFSTLTAEQKERLRRLFRWRFDKAQEIDRAAFMIVSDQQLVALARLEDPSAETIAAACHLPAGQEHRFGSELLEILRKD